MNFYKIVLQYHGTRYLGWQVQPKESGLTLQGELNRVLEEISKSPDVRSLGSGRTDAGVHALGQVVKIGIPLEIDPKNLIKALNVNLPSDMNVLSCEVSDEKFMPTTDARSKEYHYRFTMTRYPSAFQGSLIANCPFELDLNLMNEACKMLVGEHDFSNYFCEGTEVSSYVRQIYKASFEIESAQIDFLPTHYVFKIEGNGFLKQMVRLLVGALWNVGRGKVSLDDFKRSLQASRVKRLGPVAPAEGLYLFRVNY